MKEETGVDAEAFGIVGFSHFYPYLNDCANFYFVILMRPKTTTITMQASEISKCEWINVSSFLANGPSTKFTLSIISIGYDAFKDHRSRNPISLPSHSESQSSSSSSSSDSDSGPVAQRIPTDDPSQPAIFYRFAVDFRIPQSKSAYFQFFKPGQRPCPGLASL